MQLQTMFFFSAFFIASTPTFHLVDKITTGFLTSCNTYNFRYNSFIFFLFFLCIVRPFFTIKN